jgi:peptidoglycan/LPS O-acetylase OafA/YrhL
MVVLQRDALARNPRIDLLRGVAILLVVVHHLYLRVPLTDCAWLAGVPERVLLGFGMHGYEAVFLFFVISGFLITSNALQRWGRLDRIDIAEFYARRFARIVPCLLALVAVLCVLHGLRVPHYTIVHPNQSLPRAVFAALGLHLNWYEGVTGYLPGSWDVLWSLSIEEVFYIGLPLLCLAVRRTWLLTPLLLALAVSLPWTRAALAGNEIWQEKAYLPGMAAIATGVLAALWVARVPAPSRAWIRTLAIVGTLGVGTVIFADDLLWRETHQFGMLVLTGSAASLVMAAHWHERSGAHASWHLTAWIESFGRLSYEIYLTHMFVVFSIVQLYEGSGSDARFIPLWYAATAAACWLLGVGVDRGLSTPSNRSLRQWLLGSRAVQPST